MPSSRSRRRAPAPLEYAASVLPGLEQIAAREITSTLPGAAVIESLREWVVFRYTGDARDLLALRTVEDVFALLFRTMTLPPNRKGAIPQLQQMAQNSYHWDQAWTSFQQSRDRSVKRVTFRVIAQMTGRHGFRRSEVRDAVYAGVQTRWANWKLVADDAHLEVWAPVVGSWAAIGLRLSDRKMRHRTYKTEHRPASLRPTLAAAMVALSQPKPSDRFCDPMCGTGTILAERALAGRCQALLGGDLDPEALRAAWVNLSQIGAAPRSFPGSTSVCTLSLWDAGALALGSGSIDALVCNLPFGIQMGSHKDNVALYERVFAQIVRVLCVGGRAVLLSSEKELVRQCVHCHTQLHIKQEILVGVLGQAARIYVLAKHGP